MNALARDLANALTILADNAGRLVESLPTTDSATHRAVGVPATPSPVARRLIDQTTRWIPAGHRTRYREELQAELAEIAATRRWWGQVAYGLRVASRTVHLRRALHGVPVESIPGSEPWCPQLIRTG